MNKSNLLRSKSRFIFAYPVVALLLLMSWDLLQDSSWFLGLFLLASAVAIFYVYGISKRTPGKYLLPGVLLLILFQVYPAVYSGVVAFTNDSNGHQITKEQAIQAIIEDSRIPVETLSPIFYRAALTSGSNTLVIILRYPESQVWATDGSDLRAINRGQVTFGVDSKIESVSGYKVISYEETAGYAEKLQGIQIKLPTGETLQPYDLETLEVYKPSITYSAQRDELTDELSGITYYPNDNGQMESESGEVLYPGWKSYVGFKNFTSIISNEEVRRPITAVLIWTFVNAFIVVVISFLMGLALALTFNFPQMRSKRFYRTIFIIPMAIPSVLSVLVWAGLFTSETGVIDRLFGLSTPWLTDAWWARVAVLIVELWITFPYMFLITTGAIQAIPGEILEAAEIDGASPLKSFRTIKLPLVMRTVAPLLVASGAMALNNFGVIYLLTAGGPTFANSNGNAGATDILISYTYKLAFNAQEGNNYGLASALSILNFILVGGLSIYGFRRMKTMEGVN